ncbi:MAG: zinc ribbon domain-containing protein [Pseudomonadota bacterium]
MAIYEYQCEACGFSFEKWQKIGSAPIRKCPECGEKKVERLVSMTSFQLKGSGWYSDGYGPKGPLKTKKADSPEKNESPKPTKEKSPEKEKITKAASGGVKD